MPKGMLMTAAAMLAMTTAGAQQPSAPTPQAEAPAWNAADAKAAVAELANDIEQNFVHPDAARRYAAMLRANLAAGKYDGVTGRTALAEAVTADLQAVAPDGHLAMHPVAGPPPGLVAPPGAPRPVAPPPMEQAGMIAPGIAYVRFNEFMGPPDVLKDLNAFLDANEGAKTLIIDVRSHRGGGLREMDVLFSRLFAKPTTVMLMDTRASVAAAQGALPFKSLVEVPGTPDIHRAEHRVTPVAPAGPWSRAKVYLLVSGGSASAAEHLAAALKGSGRGTLVGDVTAGAGNFGGGYILAGGYGAFIPAGHSYYPGSKGWEGTGVTPDIQVAPERALYEVLVREGVPAAQAQALSDSHVPSGPMRRRRPLRS